MLCMASNDTGNTGGYVPFIRMSFVADVVKHTNYFGTYTFDKGIGGRETSPYLSTGQNDATRWIVSEGAIVQETCHDVAITALPNAPIDAETGLPVPTIAVATNGGISIIKDDGTVVDITGQTGPPTNVVWRGEKLISNGNYSDSSAIFPIPTADTTYGSSEAYYVYNNYPNPLKGVQTGVVADDDKTHMTSSYAGMSQIYDYEDNHRKSLVNNVTSTYNTGWMNGDIKLSTLNDSCDPDMGVNLISNSTFDSNMDGWDDPDSNFTWNASGKVERTSGTENSRIITQFDIIEGEWYQYDYDVNWISGHTGSNLYINTGTGYFNPHGTFSGSGHHNGYFKAFATMTLNFQLYGLYDFKGTFDNITCKRVNVVGNIIPHNAQTGTLNQTVNNNPWYSSPYNANFTYISDNQNKFSVSNNVLTLVPGATTWEVVAIDLHMKPNTMYELSFNLTKTSTSGEIYSEFLGVDKSSSINGSVHNPSPNTTVTYTEIIPARTYPYKAMGFKSNGVFAGTISNISAKEIVSNHALPGTSSGVVTTTNALRPVGTIEKNPVATGSDLAAYSGFSGSNYLQQDYTSDLDFGTGDFCMMVWSHINADELTQINTLFSTAHTTGSPAGAWIFRVANNGELWFYGSDGTWGSHHCGAINLNTWTHLCVARKDGVLSLYKDGKLASEVGRHQSNGTFSNLSNGSVSSSNGVIVPRVNFTVETEGEVEITASVVGADGYMMLFDSNNNHIESNDDDPNYGGSPFDDAAMNPAITRTLAAGDYFVTIGTDAYSTSDALQGFQSNIDVANVLSFGHTEATWTLTVSGNNLTGSEQFSLGGAALGQPLTIGNRIDYTTEFHQGKLALARISATAPSAEQLTKIYRDEKVLFQENSQATLYGTDNDVKALAYDKDTELLHAGTSSGRSVFKGLQRIDNTTTAVDTAISVANELVAED